MRIKVWVVTAFIVLLTLAAAGCGQSPYPVYERQDSEEYGITVTIEGVVYQMYPRTKWDLSPDRHPMGYAGSKETWMCWAENDTEKNFVFLQDQWASMFYTPLHRTDREIPEPSEETVDNLYCLEYDFSNGAKEYTHNHVTDAEIIRALFEALEAGTRTFDYESIADDYGISITGYSTVVPGASYKLLVEWSGKKPVCGTAEEGCVEISVELLESIMGHPFDPEKLLVE